MLSRFASTQLRSSLQRAAARPFVSATKQRVVVALGGNALLRRGEPMTYAMQQKNMKDTVQFLYAMSKDNELVITHGNGPQVGLLALMSCEYKGVDPYPLEVLGAETQGMIGHIISEEMRNLNVPLTTVCTHVEVDEKDPAFQNPTKFVGPVYKSEEDCADLAKKFNWSLKKDGEFVRRVVPSPIPKAIVEIDSVACLLNHHGTVLCCGGGGIPVMNEGTEEHPKYKGVEAVIDKDMCASLLSRELKADGLVILTDGGGIWNNFGKPDAKEMSRVNPDYLIKEGTGKGFPGSMGPKIEAAIQFVKTDEKRWAAIGSLVDAEAILDGEAGTIITNEVGKPSLKRVD